MKESYRDSGKKKKCLRNEVKRFLYKSLYKNKFHVKSIINPKDYPQLKERKDY